MNMDDGNILKKFQQIPIHTFQEIGLHHLQPFLYFIEISESILSQNWCGEGSNDIKFLSKSHLNLSYQLRYIQKI